MDPQQQEVLHYVSKFEGFRRSDEEREHMVANLLRRFQDLQTEYQKKCSDYENEVNSRRQYQDEVKRARAEISDARKSKVSRQQGAPAVCFHLPPRPANQPVQESNPFVFVVLDGDGAVFQDRFLSEGREGGAEAAHQLFTKLHHEIMRTYPEQNTEEWSVIVQVILNLDGLSKKLQACGIVKNPNEVYAFARAFGRTQPLFSFIDVGSGKEQADHKIRETLRWVVRLSQCKHIFFGPCHDNGYLPFLEEYKRNPIVAPRLTLLETTPALPGFHQLGFRVSQLDDIFRDGQLETMMAAAMRTNSMSSPSKTPSAKAASTKSSNGTASAPPPAATGASYATVGNAGNAPKPGTIITVERKKPQPKKFYVVNQYEERLDQDLPRYDPNAEKRYLDRVKKQGRNCCNRHHLRGDCDNGEHCPYAHGERMTQGELLVLRHKSRGIKCSMTSFCEDADCPLSHHCRFGNTCSLDNCRFADTHHVELVSSSWPLHRLPCWAAPC
jgi:hypothetical protein